MDDLSRVQWLRALEARRIAIIKPSALGDVVQALPLARVLRRAFPSAEISWIVNRELEDLLVGHPCLAETIPFVRRGGVRKFATLLETLRSRRFDLVFDLQGLLRTGVMTLATGARVRIGLETAREGSRWCCTDLIPHTGRDVPAHARYWRIAETLGLAGESAGVEIAITPTERSWVYEQLRGLPRPVVAVHAGAGWATKRWPAPRFAAALKGLAGTVVVVGSKAELPLAEVVMTELKESGAPILNLAGRTTLRQLASLLGAVDAVVSNDSGPMHLAAAMQTPVVGVFTCTSPRLSGPGGAQHELVATSVACAASYCKKCPQRGAAHLACFEALPVERVRMALERVLRKSRAVDAG
ncbi:MAG: glycosyltransferase family 9 protein [Planctomycetaceae bacterium]|nr:MAG: glycosyltransferase family 9 protein [Planctomycetaceae bacterium]